MPYVVTTKVAESGTPHSVHFAGRPELVAHTHTLLPNLKKHISMFPRLSSPHLGLPSKSWPQVAALPEVLFSCLLTLPFENLRSTATVASRKENALADHN